MTSRMGYLEQSMLFRKQWAEVLEKEEQWSEAARVLSYIDFGINTNPSKSRAELENLIKIAMLYLEDSDHVNAESFIKQAAHMISKCNDEGLQLQYKVRLPPNVLRVSLVLLCSHFGRQKTVFRSGNAVLRIEFDWKERNWRKESERK